MADTFRSERLVYRAIEDNDEDISFLHSLNLESKGRINNYNSLFKPANKTLAKERAAMLREELLGVIICLPISCPDNEKDGSDAYIGRANLRKIEEKGRHYRNTKTGIMVAEAYQNKGYGSETIKWILKWVFRVAGLHRVGIGCFSYSLGARKFYERLGFVYEGR